MIGLGAKQWLREHEREWPREESFISDEIVSGCWCEEKFREDGSRFLEVHTEHDFRTDKSDPDIVVVIEKTWRLPTRTMRLTH